MSWTENSQDSLRLFLENMVGMGLLARDKGIDVSPSDVVRATLPQIVKIAEESMPLARVMDNSDIVLHAEGPGAAHGMPWLSALAWMMTSADANLRMLCGGVLDVLGTNGRALARQLDIRVPGIAPGSLWIGVKVMPPPADLLPEDLVLLERLTGQLAHLPTITRFIDDEGMRPGIEEAEPDPALRDIQLNALFRLSPTGRRGIHTMEISSQSAGSATLSQRERVVLREVISKPQSRNAASGSFVGRMREADLDKTRFHLREVADIGTLRCVMRDLTAEHARAMFGGLVRVEGRYETNSEGRPRLLFVERLTPIEQREIPV